VGRVTEDALLTDLTVLTDLTYPTYITVLTVVEPGELLGIELGTNPGNLQQCIVAI
jgi:hypothetical protein